MYKITVPAIISYPHFDRDGILAELRRSWPTAVWRAIVSICKAILRPINLRD